MGNGMELRRPGNRRPVHKVQDPRSQQDGECQDRLREAEKCTNVDKQELSGSNGSSSGHHIFEMTPRIRVLLRAQRHLSTVEPIQVPVFNAMDALVRVHVDPELIARASPTELPTPVTLQSGR